MPQVVMTAGRRPALWLAAVLGLLAACGRVDEVPPLVHATLLDTPRPVAEFRLLDQYGETFEQADMHGRWTVVFSGFTHCPDVCPVTLGLLRAATQRLDGAPGFRTVLVTVDPERDTPEELRDYLDWFDAGFIGLTGAKVELDRLLDSLGMAHVRVPLGNGEYTVDHTTALALIDPRARLIGYWKAPLDMDKLAEDFGRLPAP